VLRITKEPRVEVKIKNIGERYSSGKLLLLSNRLPRHRPPKPLNVYTRTAGSLPDTNTEWNMKWNLLATVWATPKTIMLETMTHKTFRNDTIRMLSSMLLRKLQLFP